MHRLFIPPDQLASPRVKLTPEQARYLGTVLRLRPGEEIEVFDGKGARFRAWLHSLGGDEGRGWFAMALWVLVVLGALVLGYSLGLR